jgi:hypothetical protein
MLRTFETKHGWFQAHTQEEADQIALTGQMVARGTKDAEPMIDTASSIYRRRAQSAASCRAAARESGSPGEQRRHARVRGRGLRPTC